MVLDYVGIDVSKSSLDIHSQEAYWQVPNSKKEIEAIAKKISKLLEKEGKKPLFVLEPTGGYERLLVRTLQEKDYSYHLAHANKIRHFARSKGQLAKTDRIDARMIRDYGVSMQVSADEQRLSAIKVEMGDLVKRREQLMSCRQQELNRLDKLLSESSIESIKLHIEWLDEAIKGVEKQLSVLSQAEEIKPELALLTSVKGIGSLTGMYLMSYLPELGHVTSKEISALVGVAPYNHDSGKLRGKRFIYGGRYTVRKALYMAAISSIKWNPDLSRFYRRLVDTGKPAKVALIAVVRKMVCLLNAIVKRQTPWLEKAPLRG